MTKQKQGSPLIGTDVQMMSLTCSDDFSRCCLERLKSLLPVPAWVQIQNLSSFIRHTCPACARFLGIGSPFANSLFAIPLLVCLLLIILFAIFFSTLAVQQHRVFQTNGLDLGNVDQALWYTAQGHFLHFTLMTPIQSRLALHVEPILLLFVPLYWLNLGGPEMLLIVQATVVSIGAWPLYHIADHKLNATQHAPRNTRTAHRPPPISHAVHFLPLVFPLSYLLLPTLESAVLFDFHAVTLAPTFLLFAFWALVQKKDVHFIIFSLLAMACKEDLSLVVAMLGLYAGLARWRWRLAGLTIGLSLAWFALALLVIQPRFAPGGNIQLDRYAWLGDTPLAMVQTMFTQPGLVFDHVWSQANLPGYLSMLFFPTAFLALLSPLTLLPMLPTLAVNLLSANPFTWRLEDFHYGAPLAPFLFISAIYGIRGMGEWANGRTHRVSVANLRIPYRAQVCESANTLPGTGLRMANLQNKCERTGRAGVAGESSLPPRTPATLPSCYPATLLPCYPALIILLTLLLLTFTAVYHSYRGFTPLARPFLWPRVTAHHRQLEALLQTIPAETPLFTQSNLAPHLTRRAIIYTDFAYFTDPNFPAPTPVADIVLDVTTFENLGGLHEFLHQTLLDRGHYQVVAARDGVLHLRTTNDERRTTNDERRPTTNGPRTTDHGPRTTDSEQRTMDTNSLPPTPTPYSLLPTSFYTFAYPTTPPDYELEADFGNMVRLHGYSLHFNRQEEIQVSLDLEPLQPLTGIQPVLYLLDATGQPAGATIDRQPTLVWFPPEQWPVGETVRVHFNTFPWHTRQTEAYRLALGLVSGDDVWDVGRRHRPVISRSTELAPRLSIDGTLVELARLEQVWGIPAGGPLIRQFTPPRLAYSLPVNFDDQVRLLGYRISSSQSPPGRPSASTDSPGLALRLYWQAITTPPNLSRFVQLVGPDGLVYSQHDSAPDNGHYPTALWQPGEVVVETVTLPMPIERPPGSYSLHLGLYHPDTGQRLPLLTGDDHVEITHPFFNPK